MHSYLIVNRRYFFTAWAVWLRTMRARLGGLFVRVEELSQNSDGLSSTWVVGLVALGLILCVMPICLIVLLILLGPAIGNVFSNVIEVE